MLRCEGSFLFRPQYYQGVRDYSCFDHITPKNVVEKCGRNRKLPSISYTTATEVISVIKSLKISSAGYDDVPASIAKQLSILIINR